MCVCECGLDAAVMMCRPGRFDVIVYVPPPDLEGRLAILKLRTKHLRLSQDVDLPSVAARTDCYTGAELEAVCREAAMAALREDFMGATEVAQRHFEAAVRGVRPLLTTSMIESYANWPPTNVSPSKMAL